MEYVIITALVNIFVRYFFIDLAKIISASYESTKYKSTNIIRWMDVFCIIIRRRVFKKNVLELNYLKNIYSLSN